MSETRKRYIVRLVCRCAIFLACLWCCFAYPEVFAPLEKGGFFRRFSPLHILWLIWMADMFQQIVPIKNKLPLGSMKLFSNRFRPILDKWNYENLRSYVISTTKAAYKVFLIWCGLIAAIGLLYFSGIIGRIGLFAVSVAFYVCDLICVLVWCPFRLLMRTRCCTTCRIFNWDHLMMFSPLIFLGGFYAVSLVSMAVAAWLVWELCIMMYPERFWERSNAALRCSECTDKLCTQYCRKLRK